MIKTINLSIYRGDSHLFKVDLSSSGQPLDAASGVDKVPSFEVATWPLQAAEAKAWAANKSAPTPILDQIAASRGVPADVLKEAVLKKTLAMSN